MRQKEFWLRTFNVRYNEGSLVKKLFLLQFFQGAGIAFFFTASFALFLNRVDIIALPQVFVYSSFLLWATGLVYSWTEHRVRISNLAVFITVFMGASMLFLRVAYDYIPATWFLYFMLAWFNVLYLLNNLEFWGLASLMFDVRQSKRLFGVISAGDIPAKFIGYTLALLLVEYIGTINLLLIGVICMGASIPFLISIKKTVQLPENRHHQKKASLHATEPVSRIVKDFSVNILIRRLAILSIIITGSLLLINFIFYASVKEAYHDDVSLAKFIAFFLATVRIIAIFIKLTFTSRLINRLGIVASLLITPIVLLVLMVVIAVLQLVPGYQKIILYLFGITFIVVDTLRSSIGTPVFLTIMQPLSTHERLRAHTLVKGIMDPFALLATGLLLLAIIRYTHRVDLLAISYIFLVVCLFWIIGVYRVNSQYLITIIKTLSSRYFNLENFTINDSGAVAWLKEKIKTGTETEVANIIHMLYHDNNDLPEDIAAAVLQHPSDKVKMAVLQLMQQNKPAYAQAVLQPFLQQQHSPAITADAIRILCRNSSGLGMIIPYLSHTEQAVQKAALEGLYFFGTGAYQENAACRLKALLASADMNDRLAAAEILSSPDGKDQDGMILQLMNDENAAVRKPAFAAAGKSGDDRLLRELLDKIGTDEAGVMQALYIAGEQSLPLVNGYVSNSTMLRAQREKFIRLYGRIGGSRAQQMLLGLLEDHPEDYATVIKALYRSKYLAKRGEGQPVLITMARKLLLRSAGILYMQHSLEPQGQQYQLLVNSFQLELYSLRESILYLFAMVYDRDNITRVRNAYATGKKENIINAMEIIDITVRKDLAHHFNTIFEPGKIADRLNGLMEIYPAEFFEDAGRILVRVLGEDTRLYNNWTTACALYTAGKEHLGIDSSLIRKYAADENRMVRETAAYAL